MSVADRWFAPWRAPYPPAVIEIADRLENLEVGLCEHIDDPATYAARRIFWLARFPDKLLCALCMAPLAGALRQAMTLAPSSTTFRLNRCDRCESTLVASHRRTVCAGNVLLVIELCNPCLDSEAGSSGEPAAEDLARRDGKNGVRYG